MNDHSPPLPKPAAANGGLFRIVVFEQDGSGQKKVAGIRQYGRDIEISRIISISAGLPPIIDYPEEYIEQDFSADLILDFLRHPDLSDYLALVCRKKGIPVIASGKKTPSAITPFTCCGLGRLPGLGAYGEQFGMPEFAVIVRDGHIDSLVVRRGASCGATWEVVPRIVGLSVDKALSAIGREVQYLCLADPSRFDPISGKSALHYAGKVHNAALKKALANSSP